MAFEKFDSLEAENLSVIPSDHLTSVCKYRQGSECCRYIVFLESKKDFCCVKNSDIKKKIDAVVMTAQGDNCKGL